MVNVKYYFIKGTTHTRLSQRFRNKRRQSADLTRSAGVIAKANIPLDDANHDLQDDDVAYKRNMENILQELRKPRPQPDLLKKLLKLTFLQRKKIINDSLLHTTKLLDEFPFFRMKAWVSRHTYVFHEFSFYDRHQHTM